MRFIIHLAAALSVATSTAFADPSSWSRAWPDTDFTRSAVTDWSEIMSGGPPKDGIPAIDTPTFISASQETRLDPREAVMSVTIGATSRAYPIRYLMWHEIVNDVIEGQPIAVTFCPLCNSAMVFDRRVNGQELSFGVSGLLRHSDMIMYDRQTESWWQQAIGEGIVGHYEGIELTPLVGFMQGWGQFLDAHPDGMVMDEPDLPRRYGQNPYVSYDSASRPFLFNGEMPPHNIPPLMRVVRVGDKAWTFDRLRDLGSVSEAGVTLTWSSGQASALDTNTLGQGREVGSIRVTDASGKDVPHDVLFAFAFHAFYPDGQWMLN
jgi:hypothetical protein